YGQGFHFYKPMPIEMFAELLKDGGQIDYNGIQSRQASLFDIKRMLRSEILSTEALNKLIGAVGFYTFRDNYLGVLSFNDQYSKLVGRSEDEKIEKNNVLQYVHPEDQGKIQTAFINAKEHPELETRVIIRRKRPDGSYIWVSQKIFYLRERGEQSLYCATASELSSENEKEILRKNNNELLRENEELSYYISVLPGAYHRCTISDGYQFLYISDEYVRMFGFSREQIRELFENRFLNMVHPEDQKRLFNLFEQVKRKEVIKEKNVEYRMITSKGYIWVRDQGNFLDCPGERCMQGIVFDVTEERKRRNKLKKQAERDYLTNLLNRQSAFPMIRNYLEEIREETAAFIMLDMDNFKDINDTKGHPCGDHIIAACARRIRSFFRKEDIVCRLGGDEFCIFCKNISKDALEKKLEVLMKKVEKPIGWKEEFVSVTLSAGYAMVSAEEKNFEKIYNSADQALLQAKKQKRICI
ncbi:MAG: diguanylate cyclase, partial [Lachnospiraceae bacterium]|nr:diguanylate cyclase [Lachnospiraceae bacterium]